MERSYCVEPNLTKLQLPVLRCRDFSNVTRNVTHQNHVVHRTRMMISTSSKRSKLCSVKSTSSRRRRRRRNAWIRRGLGRACLNDFASKGSYLQMSKSLSPLRSLFALTQLPDSINCSQPISHHLNTNLNPSQIFSNALKTISHDLRSSHIISDHVR